MTPSGVRNEWTVGHIVNLQDSVVEPVAHKRSPQALTVRPPPRREETVTAVA